MVQVGIFLRAARGRVDEVAQELRSLGRIQTIPLETPETLGAVIDAEDLDDAEARLSGEIRNVPGVLCAWPVHAALEERSRPGAARSGADGAAFQRSM